jgi:hypothetical protein
MDQEAQVRPSGIRDSRDRRNIGVASGAAKSHEGPGRVVIVSPTQAKGRSHT